MQTLLTHPSGLTLLHAEGRWLELRQGERSILGPFTFHWEYTGSHGQVLELAADVHTLSSCDVDADGTVRLEYALYAGARPGALIRLTEGGLEIRPFLIRDRAAEARPLAVMSFLVQARSLAGSFLEGLGEAGGWRFFNTAYNSFSPAFARDSRAVQPVPPYPTAGSFNQYTDSPYWGKWSDLSTPWMGTFHQAGMADTLLVGWLEAKVGLGEVAIRRRKPSWLEARIDFGGKELRQGEELVGDPLWLAFGPDGDGLIRHWTALVARRMEARPIQSPVPTGWCSWYYYYTKVTEQDCLQNLKTLEDQKGRLPVMFFQLDDGYQGKIGDWLTVNPKFPSGLKALAARIKDAGYVPGLWTAPFFVQRGAKVMLEHPDWLLKTPDGKPESLGYLPHWGLLDGMVYGLDPSHPEVLDHLTQVYSTLAEWGIEYFKIDFLFAGLKPNRRHDPTLSPVEAYRKGLLRIREAIGDRFLLGCGAPLMPSVGVVDAMRISSDVKEAWKDPVIGLLAKGAGHPSAELAVLNCLTRSHLHGVWWLNDPDCLLVREQRSSLKLVEVQSLLTVLSLTGGMLFLSDDLTRLSPDRRALAELTLPAGGPPARTLGLREEPKPRRYIRSRTLSDGTLEVLGAVINWEDHLVEWTIAPEELELPTGDYHVWDYWTRTYKRLRAGEKYAVTLDPHETALVLFRSRRPYPQLITATHHLGQTTTVVKDERWDEAGILTVSLATGADREGQVLISLPDGFSLGEVETAGGAHVTGRSSFPGGVRLTVLVNGEGLLRIGCNRG